MLTKIDLSMSSKDRKELYASLDTLELLKLFEVSDLDKLISENEEIWWTGEAEEYLIDKLGMVVVASGNTYNHESDLTDIMQWSIMAAPDGKYTPELYKEGILLVQLHHGGDARGNYGKVKAYRWGGEDDFFFLEACVGWNFETLEGERLETDLTRRFETGYCQNPTYELNKHIVEIVELNEDFAVIRLDDGSTVKAFPEHNGNYM